jgi:hypothetical protein
VAAGRLAGVAEVRARAGVFARSFITFVKGETVYMIDVYAKNEKENLTDAEKNQLRRLAKAIGH